MWSAPSFLFLLFTHFADGQGNEKEIKVHKIFVCVFCTLVTNLQKVEFEETLGGMVEAMTEIQGRADSMMEEIKAREVAEKHFFDFIRTLGQYLIIKFSFWLDNCLFRSC